MPRIDPRKLQVRIDGQLYTYSELRILALLVEADSLVQQNTIAKQINVSSGTVSEKTRALVRKGLAQQAKTGQGVECADKTRAQAILDQVDFSDFEDKIEAARLQPKKMRARRSRVERPRPSQTKETEVKAGVSRLSFLPLELEMLLFLVEVKRPIALQDIRLQKREQGVKAVAKLERKGLVRASRQGKLKFYECSNLGVARSILKQLRVSGNE